MDTKTELLIDYIMKLIKYEIAEHENTYHLDNDCTPVKERKEMEDAKTNLSVTELRRAFYYED